MLTDQNGLQIPCICVTNRKLCRGDFYEKLKQIADKKEADAILLREKDLTEEEYFEMAARVMKICSESGKECILHTFYLAALELKCKKVHLPLGIMGGISREILESFSQIGSSVHSREQLEKAVSLGAGYVIAGHVFETDCKKGMPGRGLDFVREISAASPVPVYGIGGIDTESAAMVTDAGARGVCIMSGFMKDQMN